MGLSLYPMEKAIGKISKSNTKKYQSYCLEIIIRNTIKWGTYDSQI
jgi:hypothetical protein